MNWSLLFDDVFITAARGDSAGHWRAAFQWDLNSALGFYLLYIVL